MHYFSVLNAYFWNKRDNFIQCLASGTHQPSEKDDEYRLKSLIDLRLDKLQQESSTGGFTPRSRRGQGHASEGQGHENQGEAETKEKTDGEVQFVTERKEIRNKYVT